ncbi:HAMP domain-containing sensor histidine kinase [Streptomyces sp. WMMC500]|uniref:sensor histidine kinase n=1 Tax=Streptomyces sp. WMMC500 TaxID=3015154 RepID=UPI00248D3239|nr:HAMP domain-containing sensor histidine kinase [Streptomyces sp. WMMC500]WBB63805.1 HAMP domain-containing sensor histidine kinase [Streptomyces sp. WMMC500]
MRRRKQRSLLLRLVGLSLAVAALGGAATALLAAHGTSGQPRDAPAGDAPLPATDGDILDALYTYADEHPRWHGVESLVRDLATDTGRRIALTDPDGTTIADSALLLGDRRTGLPPAPAARIDASYPPTPDITPVPTLVARAPGRELGFHGWQLTEAERRQRQTLVEQAADCARRTGRSGTANRPERTRHRAEGTAGPGSVDAGARPSVSPCVPAALLAPSAASRRLQAEIVEHTTACLDERGLAYVVRDGAVQPATTKSPGWTQCVDTAQVEAKRPYVAAPADLYLGESDRFDPFSREGRWRTVTTAAVVLLVTAVSTALAGRRLVRPVRTLTRAVRRMAAGDHTARVPPVRGNDEITRLTDAFNTMAASIDTANRQHRAMVGDVAHELRTPLANVRSYLEAAQDGVLPLDPDLIHSLVEESSLLERLVADLQDLALADAGMLRIHPEETDATDLAEQAVAAHRAGAQASGVDLRLTASGPVTVRADPVRLRQALGNLVSNAVRHTQGGSVEVTVDGYEDDERGDTVTLTVADTGSGIAPEHLPHVFDRLYRADPARSRSTGGAGLGLAIATHLVEAHHGHIEVTSAPGAGSTFTIRLPAKGPPECPTPGTRQAHRRGQPAG